MAKIEIVNADIDEIRLKRNVLIGYTDIAAAGSRVLLGANMRLEFFKIQLVELQDHSTACIRDTPPAPTEEDFGPFQVLNCKYEEYSLVVVNTVLNPSRCHYVVNRILDLCSQSQVEKVILMSALRMSLLAKQLTGSMFEKCLNSAKPVTKCPTLPDDIRISDAFVNTFVQMAQVEGLPTSCILLPGNKAAIGQASASDGSLQVISQLHEVISAATSLQFNLQLSLSLIYRGRNEQTVDMVSEIYA